MTKLKLVLVNPQYAGNVGYCARSVGNMGAENLIIIAPECDLEEERAKQMAAGSQASLKDRVVYESWDEFLAKEPPGLRIAMTARDGKNRSPDFLPQLLDQLNDREDKILKDNYVYIILGPEDDGLNASDIERVHLCAKLPTYGKFKSLNLGHAAQLSLYICQEFFNRNGITASDEVVYDKGDSNIAPPTKDLVEKWALEIGFSLQSNKRNIALRIDQILQRAVPTNEEYKLLEKMIRQSLRKIEDPEYLPNNSKLRESNRENDNVRS
ncbi:MAG: TrmH family RNA methyltransferase [Bdellovibrionales bacterium]